MLRYVVYFYELLDRTNNRLEVIKRGDPSWENNRIDREQAQHGIEQDALEILEQEAIGQVVECWQRSHDILIDPGMLESAEVANWLRELEVIHNN